MKQWLIILERSATALVDRILGVDQSLVIVDQPRDTVRSAPFFVSRQCKNEIALRYVAFLFVAQQIRDKHRRHRLVVRRAASEKESVLFNHDERIARPVTAQRRDHIEVREQQQRLPLTFAMIADDQVSLGWPIGGNEDLHVRLRKSRRDETRRHRTRCLRDVTDGVDRIDFDKLLVDLTRCFLLRRQRGGCTGSFLTGKLAVQRRGESQRGERSGEERVATNGHGRVG